MPAVEIRGRQRGFASDVVEPERFPATRGRQATEVLAEWPRKCERECTPDSRAPGATPGGVALAGQMKPQRARDRADEKRQRGYRPQAKEVKQARVEHVG